VGGSQSTSLREDVAVRLLAEGEISSAEFLSLAFPDVEIYPTELAEEYSVALDANESPAVVYLTKIAEKLLAPADIAKINSLLGHDKKKEAFQYLTSYNPWVKQHFAKLQAKGSSQAAETTLQQLREIEQKATEVHADIEPEEETQMQAAISF